MADKKPVKISDDQQPLTSLPTENRGRARVAGRADDKAVRAGQRWEQEAARLRAFNDLLWHHTSDWVFRLDQEGKLRATSPSTNKLLGFGEEALVGRSFQDLLAPADRLPFKRFLASALAQSELIPFRWSVRASSGALVPMTGVGQALPHPQTQVQQVECLARLVAFAEPPLGDRPAPEHFGFMLAHELIQPLASVAMSARAGLRLLEEDATDRKDLLEAFELAATHAEQAAFLIRELRQLTLGQKPGKSWINLRSLLLDCLHKRAFFMEDYPLDLEVPADFPPLFADRVQLELVFINLVKNALEAMRTMPLSERRLAIRASHGPGQVEIILGDVGHGLAPGQAERLFEPFHSSKGQGMGLGLALSRWIVQAHGGRLTVAGSSPTGTVFHIMLPLGEENPHHEEPTR